NLQNSGVNIQLANKDAWVYGSKIITLKNGINKGSDLLSRQKECGADKTVDNTGNTPITYANRMVQDALDITPPPSFVTFNKSYVKCLQLQQKMIICATTCGPSYCFEGSPDSVNQCFSDLKRIPLD
ncbi:MAG TPA: hypothetical protein VN711_03315, partial [Candidatus Saccharimonadales bacterium]|nr:hypothetical protein [Candidatus Saccharimonadales bacterium]